MCASFQSGAHLYFALRLQVAFSLKCAPRFYQHCAQVTQKLRWYLILLEVVPLFPLIYIHLFSTNFNLEIEGFTDQKHPLLRESYSSLKREFLVVSSLPSPNFHTLRGDVPKHNIHTIFMDYFQWFGDDSNQHQMLSHRGFHSWLVLTHRFFILFFSVLFQHCIISVLCVGHQNRNQNILVSRNSNQNRTIPKPNRKIGPSLVGFGRFCQFFQFFAHLHAEVFSLLVLTCRFSILYSLFFFIVASFRLCHASNSISQQWDMESLTKP